MAAGVKFWELPAEHDFKCYGSCSDCKQYFKSRETRMKMPCCYARYHEYCLFALLRTSNQCTACKSCIETVTTRDGTCLNFMCDDDVVVGPVSDTAWQYIPRVCPKTDRKECGACHLKIKKIDNVIRMPCCHHLFHETCISRVWRERAMVNVTCPHCLCRLRIENGNGSAYFFLESVLVRVVGLQYFDRGSEEIEGMLALHRQFVESSKNYSPVTFPTITAAAGIECSICLETSDKEMTQLPCMHCFHEKCIEPWLLQTGNCPNCRYPL